MGDHWKSLAQKLGAPGTDDPTTSTNESAPVPEAAAPEATPNQEFVEPLAEVMTPAPEPEVVDTKPRKRSSWESLASMFNIQIDRTPEPEPVAPPKPAAPVAPVVPPRESRPAAHREKPRFNEPRRERDAEPRLQVFQESRDSDNNPALESMFADAPRGDIDSWKKPARMVDDIGWGDDDPVEPVKEVEPEFIAESFASDIDLPVEDAAEATERPSRRRRRRRGPRRPEGAADAAPRAERDLDDVEAIVPGDEYAEPESFEADLSETAEPVGSADPERRSSRRRRRGRKRPTDDAVGPARQDDGELNAERASERTGDRPERLPRPDRDRPERSERSDRERSGERGSERGERSPDRGAERGSDRGGDRPERSSDRGRGRRSEPTEVADRSVERDADRGSERSGYDRNEPAARPERGEGRSEGRGEGRRDKRGERSEPRADRPPRVREDRPLPPRSDIEEHDEGDDLEDLDANDSGDKHRNIPSWADSLQAIIEGNMENHKRNDNRGGPPRGRPRPRR